MNVYIVMVLYGDVWWPLEVFSSTYAAEDRIKECVSKESFSSYKFKIVKRKVSNG